MLKTRRFKRKWLHYCPVLLFCITSFFTFATDSYAFDAATWWHEQTWRPVIGIGVGGYLTTNAGESQDFPILNPITDEFYNYSPSRSSQAAALVSVFLGSEWAIADRDWLMQAGLEFTQTSALSASGSVTQGADVGSQDSYTFNYNISTQQLLLEGKLLYTWRQFYHPYVMAGLGPAFNKASGFSTNIPPFLTFTRMYNSNSTTSFSYALGFGVDMDFNDKLRIGVGYRFTNLGQVTLGSASVNNVSVPGSLTQNHLYANQLLVQMTVVL